MPPYLLNHASHGAGAPPVVMVHGFGCDHTDWDGVVPALSRHRRVVVVDLPAHRLTLKVTRDVSIERFGADIADLLLSLKLERVVLVGHSLGCRVVTEAALQAPDRVAGLVLVDGSQFAPAMAATLRETFAQPDGYQNLITSMFRDMFTARADAETVEHAVARANRLPAEVGQRLMLDLQRYDVTRLDASWRTLHVPVMAVQSTYTNEKRERASLRVGQSTPYLDALRAAVPDVMIEVIPDTGHFPQVEAPAETSAAIERFLARLG